MLAEDAEEYQCEVSTTIPDLESLELISSDALHLYSASKAKPNGKTRGLVNSPGLLCRNKIKPIHITVKLLKSNDTEKVLRAARNILFLILIFCFLGLHLP